MLAMDGGDLGFRGFQNTSTYLLPDGPLQASDGVYPRNISLTWNQSVSA